MTNKLKLKLSALTARLKVGVLNSPLVRRITGRTVLANAFNDGRHHTGNTTWYSDAVITERYRLAKLGSDATHVAVCGAADTPIGVITDEAGAIGDPLNVSLLGRGQGTQLMVASGVIAQGALLEPAANGRVQTLGAGVGTHHVVGRALSAASAAGDPIEVDVMYFLRVI